MSFCRLDDEDHLDEPRIILRRREFHYHGRGWRAYELFSLRVVTYDWFNLLGVAENRFIYFNKVSRFEFISEVSKKRMVGWMKFRLFQWTLYCLRIFTIDFCLINFIANSTSKIVMSKVFYWNIFQLVQIKTFSKDFEALPGRQIWEILSKWSFLYGKMQLFLKINH